ncbi:unnamed protein product [Auanema sp. JU1783]|nr:unnamed protein product [Auanema sp. JU1783]
MSSKPVTLDDLFELAGRPQVKVYELNEPVNTNVVLNKTPVSLLEENCMKFYNSPVKFSVISTEKNNGSATSKKVAKQQAASNMIMLLLQTNFANAEKLGLRVSSLEEASAYLEPFCTDTDSRSGSSDYVPSRNYFSTLVETCKKNKLDEPTFVQMDEGPPNEKVFTTVCQVNEVSTKGQAKQKKQSKSLACYEMLKKIESGDVVSKECEDDDDLATVDIVPEELKRTRHDSEKTIEDCLEKISLSKEKTTAKHEFKMLDNLSTCGAYHCLLKIEVQSGDSKSTVIFPGRGDTEDEARKCAAKEAFIHFSI